MSQESKQEIREEYLEGVTMLMSTTALLLDYAIKKPDDSKPSIEDLIDRARQALQVVSCNAHAIENL